MGLFRVLYVSRAIEPQSYLELRRLLEVACRRNEQDGLTGLLYYSGGYFAQCLEGTRDAVNRTVGRIYRDPRHTDIVLLDARIVSARMFPTWGMKLLPSDALPPGAIQMYVADSAHKTAASGLDDQLLSLFMHAAAEMTETAERPQSARSTIADTRPVPSGTQPPVKRT